ncbi:hypothetical protein ACHMW6_05710 [Pseudoduganella sp. UC29_106]|uniref:hypothetical protein n=1 Tax=Pseudoduganella sp. UC29_106 TaxID=3374553 RepID=UPI003757E2A3
MSKLHYPIRVPSEVLEALGEFTGQCWSDSLALEPFICEAIRNYLRPAPAAQAQPAAASGTGYQWKQVFLPDGTKLRASFGGNNYFAQVEGGEIKYGEHAMSPSRFANLQGSGNRNAWKAVWLCLPGSEEWLLADVCRAARNAAIARLIGDSARTERASQERRRERRVAERRTSRGADSGKRSRDLRQPAARKSALYLGGSRPSAPAAPGAMNGNGIQRKSGTGRNGRRKRIVTSGLTGNP